MSRLTPLSWSKIVGVFAKTGYEQAGQHGSHIKLEKRGSARPLIVPRYQEVPVFIISGLIRTAGLSREEFIRLLGE